MPGNFTSDWMLVRSVMQSPKVRAKLAEVAAPGVAIANARAKSGGVSISARLSHGTRPKGRPHVEVGAVLMWANATGRCHNPGPPSRSVCYNPRELLCRAATAT